MLKIVSQRCSCCDSVYVSDISLSEWVVNEWNVLWQARQETLDPRLILSNEIDENKFASFINSGIIDRLYWMFDDEQPVTQGLENLWA